MKHLYSLFVTIISIILLSFKTPLQQPAEIIGKIRTADNKPASNVSIYLDNNKHKAVSNDKGEYRISNIAPGFYTVKAVAIGLESKLSEVHVEAGQTLILDFTLSETSAQLNEVVVSSKKTNPWAGKKSESVARIPLQNLENPQVYSTITQDLLKMQMVTNFNDAIKNAPGLDKLWSSTGRAGDGAAYYNLRGFVTQPAFVNGVAGLTNGDLDPANIEKIEIIKGPSGTLFGGALTNFGGLINIVTKQAKDMPGGEFSYTTGSFGLNRLSGDIHGKLTKSGKLAGRINASFHNQNSFQDMGFKKSYLLAPSLKYEDEKLRLYLDAQFYNSEGTNPLMVFLNRNRPLLARTPEELHFDFDRSYTSNDLTLRTPTTNVVGKAIYKLSDNWNSQSIIARSNRKSDGFYQYVMFIGATDDTLNRYVNLQNSISNTLNFQHNLNGDFYLAGMRNRLLIGIDYLQNETINNNSPYVLFDRLNSTADDPAYGKISALKVQGAIAASTANYTRNRQVNNVYSAYFSNVTDITNRLFAMLSLRVDRFESKGAYKQTALSPKLGLVYQPVKDKMSIFGNYMNGFRNVAPVVQPLPDISGNFKPQQANQLEGGTKVDLINNRLSLTASYYSISVSNMTRSESIEKNGNTYLITVQNGTQKSSGVELDLTANPVDGLNIISGFSYNKSEMTKSDPNTEGRRPVTAGPKLLINGWANYTLPKGALKGFGLGFGGNYAGKNIITNSKATGQFVLPSYTVLNASLFYNSNSYYIGLKADNLTNKTYYKGWTTVEPQSPRSFLVSISYKF